jgi:hypothetical protein
LSLRDRLFIHKGIISVVKRVEFISDRMCITPTGQYDTVVPNVHPPTEDKEMICRIGFTRN